MRLLVPKCCRLHTSFSKFAFVNSSEFKSAFVAANLTLLLGSSFRMPCTMAVRISLDWLARNFGSYPTNAQLVDMVLHTIDNIPGLHRCSQWRPGRPLSAAQCFGE